ncbi:retrovirus-related pol polyprotein from transposon TNT 1-94 [Tanacetum coccineum]|uniref:Retrovirus-related pol polyprotein from transposon TNT 1-94 n=1 Tax=Tanacetum coccineum TaxID=301880 RepID=A0ABQ4ZRL9_9ASTR
MKDKVVQKNSQVKLKKTEVDDHYRISSCSNKIKYESTCNDILKSRTSNVNAVCATYRKCVFNSNHDACVSKFINDVNARTKKPKVEPISASKPKRQANQSVVTPKKTFSSESTIQKSRSYFRIPYEKIKISSPTRIYFMAKESPTHAWLWHRRLSYLNFDTINLLSKKDIVNGLPKLKYVKDQLCSSCKIGKAKQSTFKIKTVPSSKGRSKDETPKVLKDFLKMIQQNLQAQVITIRTDKDTKFLNKTLHAYFKEEGIEHQTSIARTPEQNSIVERRNRTLVEAAQTMLSGSKLPFFFWLRL